MMDSSTRLRFERLEEKKLLAGDVAVSVVAGALLVEGDELGNQAPARNRESISSPALMARPSISRVKMPRRRRRLPVKSSSPACGVESM